MQSAGRGGGYQTDIPACDSPAPALRDSKTISFEELKIMDQPIGTGAYGAIYQVRELSVVLVFSLHTRITCHRMRILF
jgi:hypothetical protein